MQFSDEHHCHSATPSPAAIFRFTTQSSEKMFDGKAEINIHKKPDSIPFSFGSIDLKVGIYLSAGLHKSINGFVGS